MTFKYLLSRIATLFSIILLTTTTLEASGRAAALAGIFFGFFIFLIGSFIPFFLLFTAYKKSNRIWLALLCAAILFGSYIVGIFIGFLGAIKLRFSSSVSGFLGLFFIAHFFTILVQFVAWILLFRKDTWSLIIRLILISMLYPIACAILAYHLRGLFFLLFAY